MKAEQSGNKTSINLRETLNIWECKRPEALEAYCSLEEFNIAVLNYFMLVWISQVKLH